MTAQERPEATVWRLPGSEGKPCVNVHLYEARGPLKVDSKTTLPPAGRRILVDVHRESGWFIDPNHLDQLARRIEAAADWLRDSPDPDAGDQLKLALTEEATAHA